MASLGSYKVVTAGGAGYQGLQAPDTYGIWTPAGVERNLDAYIALEGATNRNLRVAVNSFNAADERIRAIEHIRSYTAAASPTSTDFYHEILNVPKLDVDSYQQVSITTGPDGVSYPSITFYVDDLALDDVVPVPSNVLLDNFWTQNGLAGNSLTKSITVANNSLRELVVAVHFDSPGRAPSLTGGSVTFNGVALTLKQKAASNGLVEIWHLVNPPAVTANVVATFPNAVQAVLGIFSLYNVDQTTPFDGAPVVAQATNAGHPTLVNSVPAPDYVITAMTISATSSTTLTPDSAPNSKYNIKQYSTFGIHGAADARLGTGGPVTYGWVEGVAGSGQPSTIISVAVKSAAPPSAPVNTVAPVVSGSVAQDSLLSTTTGTWSPAADLGYTYVWYRANTSTGGGAVSISGADGPTYTSVFADVGKYLFVVVTGRNAGGTTPKTSNIVGPITVSTPVNVGLPSLDGPFVVGGVISSVPGTWNNMVPGASTDVYDFTLQADDGKNGVFTDFRSAVTSVLSDSYTLLPSDNNFRFRWKVTAHNAHGTTVAYSLPSAPIGPATPVIDNANRGDQNPITLPYTSPIQSGANPIKIAGNRFKSSSGSTAISSQASRSDIASADVRITGRVPDLPTENNAGAALWGRVHHPGHPTLAEGYSFDYLLNAGFAIFKMTSGGAFAQLGSYVTSHVLAIGETLRFDILGNQLTGYWVGVDGVAHQVITFTDSSSPINGIGEAGFELNTLVGSIDDYNVEAITPHSKYTVSRWVRVPLDYNGSDIRIGVRGFGIDLDARYDMSIRDAWQRQQLTFQPTLSLSGDLIVYEAGGLPTTGRSINIDWAQTEIGDYATPFALTARTGARLQALASNLSPIQGWAAFWCRPGFASTQSRVSTLFSWRDTNTKKIEGYWDGAAGQWKFERANPTNGTLVNIADSFALRQLKLVTFMWTSTTIMISIDGSAPVSFGNTYIPSMVATMFDIGAEANGDAGSPSKQFDGSVLYAARGGAKIPTNGQLSWLYAQLSAGHEPGWDDFLNVGLLPVAVYPMKDENYVVQGTTSAPVLSALLEQKPAGILLRYLVLPGQDYQQLFNNFATYQTVYDTYQTYQGLLDDQPGV